MLKRIDLGKPTFGSRKQNVALALAPCLRYLGGDTGSSFLFSIDILNAPNPPDKSPVTEFSTSGGFASRLARLGCSVGFTSYQSNLLYLVGRNGHGGLQIHQAQLAKPMGIGFRAPDKLAVSGGQQIFRFHNVLSPDQRANGIYDACFVPRVVHFTGRLDAHDIGLDTLDAPVFVNTRFNCLAATDHSDSFKVLWHPPFISDIVDEDRCHLNGLAMRDGCPAYASAISRSDTIDGWRDRRADGGVVIDIETGAVVCEGLSMPHSPRLHKDTLWLLNSGTGELGRVVLPRGGGKGRFEPVAFCPGFVRGLSFLGDHAFVGLSKPRYKRFEGLALDDRLAATDSEPWCGVQVIDIKTGACVDWLRLDGPVAELYDVEVLPGISCPMAVSPGSGELANLVTHSYGSQAGTSDENGKEPTE